MLQVLAAVDGAEGASHIANIAKIQLAVLTARLAHMDLALAVTDAAVAELAKVSFDPVFGARPLKPRHSAAH